MVYKTRHQKPIPHKERRVEAPLISEGKLFPRERTEEINKMMVAMLPPSGGSESARLLTAMTQIVEDTQNFSNRIHSQEIVNAKEIAERKSNNSITADQLEKLPDSIAYQVQPPPSDIWAAMRSTEPILRANGDIWQTILIPAQVMFNKQKPIRILRVKDKGAQKKWEEFFDDETGIIPINKLARDAYFTLEQYAQWFPLEYWKGKDLQGIAAIEPTSMWVGHHLGMGYPPMSIVNPESFDEAKWNDMVHDAAYTTFVNDMNVQAFPAFRIPLPPDVLQPVFVFGKKMFERYAIPHLSRAYIDIMFRMMLHEYRQGVLEDWIAQIIYFVVKGYGNQPPSKGAVNLVKATVDQIIANHSGTPTFGYDVEGRIIKPEPLTNALSPEMWADASQTIYRSIGFDVFLVSGEIAGTHGRGGGVQVEVSVKVGMERWKSHLVGYFDWCRHIASKWAEKNDKTLLKHLPYFALGPNALETQDTIEKVVKPMFAAGLMSPQTALERADESYESETMNKELHQPNKELYEPPPTFAQSSKGPPFKRDDYDESEEPPTDNTTYQQNPGRPKGSKTQASIRISTATREYEDLKSVISRRFTDLMANVSRENVMSMCAEVESSLRAQMGATYTEGYHHYGGTGEPELEALTNAPQGIKFQIGQLGKLKTTLLDSIDEPERLGTLKSRAEQYAGALSISYALGMQQAAKKNGAVSWQRVLHPELSNNACPTCLTDSAIVHPMTELFNANHPLSYCSEQALRFNYGDNAMPVTAMVPPVAKPGHRTRRAPVGGLP